MEKVVAILREQMAQPAEKLDFEEAERFRDSIRLNESGAVVGDVEHVLLLQSMRQRPGAMGLGTGQAQIEPPSDWKRPKKRDLKGLPKARD